MTTTTIDPLKEARRIARSAGLFFSGNGTEYRVYRKTPARPVYLGKRSSPALLLGFVKRCAGAK